jgi:type IV fimbrial biogenesis protein FimT
MLDYKEGGGVLSTYRLPWQRGMTLIEVLIAMAILGVLVAMAMPVAGEWLLNAQIRTAAEGLQDGLQQARNEAVRRNTAVEFRLLAGTGWEVRLADTLAANRILGSRPSSEGAPNAYLTSAPAGASIVTFDGMGRRLPANVDATPVLIGICADLQPSALAAARSRDLQLNISLSGQVRMCDPKVAASDLRFCSDAVISPCGT